MDKRRLKDKMTYTIDEATYYEDGDPCPKCDGRMTTQQEKETGWGSIECNNCRFNPDEEYDN